MKNLEQIITEAFNNNINLSGETSVEDLKEAILDAMSEACIEVGDEIEEAYVNSDAELSDILVQMFGE